VSWTAGSDLRCSSEVLQRRQERIPSHALLIHAEASEEGLVEVASDIVVAFLIQPLWISNKIKGAEKDLDANRELSRGGGKSDFGLLALRLDLPKLCLDFGLRQCTVGCEIE
jgi:hypothetical protein